MKNLTFDFVPKFIKLRRDDLIGKYLGHTAIKTREALMNGLGKVIFIDEAYELYNSNDTGNDSFGMECLSAILNFMNEFSDRTIIIFAGYEDLLKKTIFRVQPGLERRIAWTFTLNPYNESELVQIYEKQLKEKNWILEDKERIIELFRKHKESFKHGGGDTQRLAMYTKTVYSDICFEKLLHNGEITSKIDYDIVMKALEILKETTENQKERNVKIPEGMYV
jgi:stage V sporulation protein K